MIGRSYQEMIQEAKGEMKKKTIRYWFDYGCSPDLWCRQRVNMDLCENTYGNGDPGRRKGVRLNIQHFGDKWQYLEFRIISKKYLERRDAACHKYLRESSLSLIHFTFLPTLLDTNFFLCSHPSAHMFEWPLIRRASLKLLDALGIVTTTVKEEFEPNEGRERAEDGWAVALWYDWMKAD